MIRKYWIVGIILCLLFILVPNIVSAIPTNPNLNYFSDPPFEVEEYDIDKVVERAIENNYIIRYSMGCLGIPHNECKEKGLIKEWYENNITDSNKILGIVTTFVFPNETTAYNVTHIGIGGSTKDLEFGINPKDSFKNPYLFTAGFKSFNPTLTTEEASEIIVDELQKLGILSEDITINFIETYGTAQAALGNDHSNLTPLFTIFGGAVVITVVILIIQKLHRRGK